MIFEKQGSSYIARGKNGYFYIRKSRGKYWAEYIGQKIAFKFTGRKFIKEAKELCQGNSYWEEEKLQKEVKFTAIKTKEMPFEKEMEQTNFL